MEAEDAMAVLGSADDASISLKEVMRAVMVEFGGPAGFARNLKLDYDNLQATVTTRVQIDRAILQALQKVDDSDPGDPGDDIEQLEATLKQAMDRKETVSGNGHD